MIDTLICMKKALSNNQGIGEDLPYLHKNCIIHLDLKHENMLLDDNMMPKILNFCLSSCFKEKQNQAIAPKQGEADLELLKVCGERMIKVWFISSAEMLGPCWFGLIAYRVLKYNLDTSSGNIWGDEPERKGDQGTKDGPSIERWRSRSDREQDDGGEHMKDAASMLPGQEEEQRGGAEARPSDARLPAVNADAVAVHGGSSAAAPPYLRWRSHPFTPRCLSSLRRHRIWTRSIGSAASRATPSRSCSSAMRGARTSCSSAMWGARTSCSSASIPQTR